MSTDDLPEPGGPAFERISLLVEVGVAVVRRRHAPNRPLGGFRLRLFYRCLFGDYCEHTLMILDSYGDYFGRYRR